VDLQILMFTANLERVVLPWGTLKTRMRDDRLVTSRSCVLARAVAKIESYAGVGRINMVAHEENPGTGLAAVLLPKVSTSPGVVPPSRRMTPLS
jgi:hypothetical protein